jgi:hypothetical protein
MAFSSSRRWTGNFRRVLSITQLIKSVDRPLILRRRGCCHRQPTSFNVPHRRVCPRCALRARRRVLGSRRATLKLRDFKRLGARYGCPPAERDHGPASKSAAAALAASAAHLRRRDWQAPLGDINNSLVARSAISPLRTLAIGAPCFARLARGVGLWVLNRGRKPHRLRQWSRAARGRSELVSN